MVNEQYIPPSREERNRQLRETLAEDQRRNAAWREETGVDDIAAAAKRETEQNARMGRIVMPLDAAFLPGAAPEAHRIAQAFIERHGKAVMKARRRQEGLDAIDKLIHTMESEIDAVALEVRCAFDRYNREQAAQLAERQRAEWLKFARGMRPEDVVGWLRASGLVLRLGNFGELQAAPGNLVKGQLKVVLEVHRDAVIERLREESNFVAIGQGPLGPQT